MYHEGKINCACPFALRTQKYFVNTKYMLNFNNKLLVKPGISVFKLFKIKVPTLKLKDKARH